MCGSPIRRLRVSQPQMTVYFNVDNDSKFAIYVSPKIPQPNTTSLFRPYTKTPLMRFVLTLLKGRQFS
jgi:hypothetical protein